MKNQSQEHAGAMDESEKANNVARELISVVLMSRWIIGKKRLVEVAKAAWASCPPASPRCPPHARGKDFLLEIKVQFHGLSGKWKKENANHNIVHEMHPHGTTFRVIITVPWPCRRRQCTSVMAEERWPCPT